MRRPALLLLAFALVVAGVMASCSFTTAGNFAECRNDVDCGSATACSHGYCLPLPPGCVRQEAGGARHEFEQAARIPVVALLPIDALSGIDESEVQSVNAMRLAISEANDQLDPSRGLFGLFVCDTDEARTDAGGGITAQTSWFIKNLQVPAFIVSSSGPLKEVAEDPVRIEAGTFVISPNATVPSLSTIFATGDRNPWRIAPPDTDQVRVLMRQITQDFPDAGGVRIAVLHQTGYYGEGFAPPLFDALNAQGYTATLHPYPKGDVEKRNKAVVDVGNLEPRATVSIGNPSDLVPIIERSRAFPVLTRDGGHRWYLTDGVKDPAIITPTTIGDLDRAYGTAPAQGAGAAYGTFVQGFRTRYGIDPGSFSYLSHSYDATWVVMLAVENAIGKGAFAPEKITGPRLVEAMAKLALSSGPPTLLRPTSWTDLNRNMAENVATNIEGTSGPLDFNLDSGFAGSPYELWQVSDGGIHVVRLINP